MSLYDTLKPYFDAGKTDAEIYAIAGLMDNPRIVPLADLNELLLASGGWAALVAVARDGSGDAQMLARTTTGLFSSKLTSFNATKIEYRTMMGQVLQLLGSLGIASEYIATINAMCGVGNPNPSLDEIAAARAEGVWLAAKAAVEATLDADYAAITESYNAQKSVLGGLAVGSTIPPANKL